MGGVALFYARAAAASSARHQSAIAPGAILFDLLNARQEFRARAGLLALGYEAAAVAAAGIFRWAASARASARHRQSQRRLGSASAPRRAVFASALVA